MANQGCIVVIRSLSLGKINPRASSATLALRIEEVSRSLIINAVHAESSGASTADAVFFRDHCEALVILTRRIAAYQSIHEWFWKTAFPDIKPVPSRSMLWKTILKLAHEDNAPLLTVASVVRETIRTGAIREMAGSVSVNDMPFWIRRLGLDSEVMVRKAVVFTPELSPLDLDIHPMLVSFLKEWGFRDPRSFWLVAVAFLIRKIIDYRSLRFFRKSKIMAGTV
jgi:hypothetical protein